MIRDFHVLWSTRRPGSKNVPRGTFSEALIAARPSLLEMRHSSSLDSANSAAWRESALILRPMICDLVENLQNRSKTYGSRRSGSLKEQLVSFPASSNRQEGWFSWVLSHLLARWVRIVAVSFYSGFWLASVANSEIEVRSIAFVHFSKWIAGRSLHFERLQLLIRFIHALQRGCREIGEN